MPQRQRIVPLVTLRSQQARRTELTAKWEKIACHIASVDGLRQTLGVDESAVSANDGSYSENYDVVVVLGTDLAT